MGIDNEFEKSEMGADIAAEAERSVQSMLTKAGIAAVLATFLPSPVAAAINQMLGDLALKRNYERMHEMFRHMGERINELTIDRIDKQWFRSEEFQSLLFEAFQQLTVTHEREKIAMLGRALANGGEVSLKLDDRKELFFRLLRDLTFQQIKLLQQLLPTCVQRNTIPEGIPPETVQLVMWRERQTVFPRGDDLLAFYMLAADGLVEETLHPSVYKPNESVRSQGEAARELQKLIKSLKEPPRRSFRLSQLGYDFLNFLGLPRQGSEQQTPPGT